MIDIDVSELINRWKPLTVEEIAQAKIYISDAQNYIFVYALDRGYDLDELLKNEARQNLYIAIICDVVKREMCSKSDDPAMSQYSQSALGYTVSGTFLTPGGGLFIKNAELKALGLMKQHIKVVNPYGD